MQYTTYEISSIKRMEIISCVSSYISLDNDLLSTVCAAIVNLDEVLWLYCYPTTFINVFVFHYLMVWAYFIASF